jgi:aspartate/methionine/tyrosine aminotransferase
MPFETFLLERNQSLYENEVEFNLTESGVEPLTLAELLTPAELETFANIRLGYNHTEGTPEARRAIASWYPGASDRHVLVTTGAAEANFVAYWTLMRAGDALAMMLPNFMQLHGLAGAFGNPLRPFHLATAADAWRLDLASFEAATGPADTRLIAVCNPNNPTGAVLSETEMDAIIAAARKRDAWLLVDEIYRGSELDGRPETPTFFGRYDKTIITSSTSKSLAHAGLRIGWLVAPPELLEEVVERQDYTTIGTGPLNQYLARLLLTPERREAMLARSRSIIGRNLEIIQAWVDRWEGRLSWRRPPAGGMAFVRYDFPIGSSELSRRIREAESVFVVAGDWFGMDGYLRIGSGGDPEHLRAGLARIDRVCAEIAAAPLRQR